MGNNLKNLREAKGWTQDQAGEAMGISKGGYIKLERGERPLNRKHIELAMKAFGVSAMEITMSPEEAEIFNALMRQAPPSAPRDSSSVNMSEAEHLPQLPNFGGPRDIPEYGAAAGGSRGKADFRFNGQVVDMAPRPPGIAKKKDVYCVRVVGDSMEPKYEEGERLYLDPHRRPAIMDYVVIELKSQEEGEPGDAFIKRLIRKTPTKYIVQQFNPPAELEFNIDEVKNIHRVIPQDELLGI
jgi:phage repressor protein C with HTH and peptisase S24 domain